MPESPAIAFVPAAAPAPAPEEETTSEEEEEEVQQQQQPVEEVASADPESEAEVDDLINELALMAEEPEEADEPEPEPQPETEPEAVQAQPQAELPPEEQPLVKLCQHLWSLATPDEEGCIGGGQLRPLMEMSGLPMEQLGTIWGLVDDSQRGKVSKHPRFVLYSWTSSRPKQPC